MIRNKMKITLLLFHSIQVKNKETDTFSKISFLSFQETTEDHPTSGVSHATSCIYTLYIYISYGVWCHQLMFAENTNKMK
mmetsp:Transcript_66386/g.74366  ORF Transcript_66386/g.74366 Transcript_66386/m.74366 type:complete len:80 (+) Transcript_66386:2090-2329(+)